MDLVELGEKIRAYRERYSRFIELPEPAVKLDLAARGDDKLRQFKHLHQMCQMHAEHFATATGIKMVAVVDGYLANAESRSALGIYLFGRSLLELAAFSHDVSIRLQAVAKQPEDNWRPKGQQFFGIVMRARFGTSNPEMAQLLREAGASKRHLEPFNIMQSVNRLITSDTGRKLRGKYDLLSDCVHHNLSSHYTSSPGSRVSDAAHFCGGGSILTVMEGPICRYQYPVPSKAKKAVEETSELVGESLSICIESIQKMPRTPFPESQLKKMTGSNLGCVQLPPGMHFPSRG